MSTEPADPTDSMAADLAARLGFDGMVILGQLKMTAGYVVKPYFKSDRFGCVHKAEYEKLLAILKAEGLKLRTWDEVQDNE